MLRMRKDFELTCADGVKLFARVWEAEHPRAALCLTHGLGEHGERYVPFAEVMNANGITVYCHDQRGHGRNVQKKSRRGIARMCDLERDVLTLIDHAKKETGLPVILFGHSLGGLVALYTTLHAKPEVAGSIVTSPWLKLAGGPPAPLLDIVSTMADVLAHVSIPNGLSASDLCRDEAVCAAYKPDPYNHEKIGLGLAGDAHKASKWVLAHPEELTVPLLLCHGDADKICAVEGSRAFAEKAQSVHCVEYAGGYHELHNEPALREALFAEELRFIDQILE